MQLYFILLWTASDSQPCWPQIQTVGLYKNGPSIQERPKNAAGRGQF